jgi:beta-glucosidase
VTFAAGETHTLDLRAFAGATNPLIVQFRWITPEWPQAKIDEAVAAAKTARKVIIFAYDEGTEGSDRGGNNVEVGLTLPGYQNALIAAVAAANPDTIVVLNTGDPVLMPWADDVKSILEMWYPGQMGGVATANVLLGIVNPGGSLPVTFPASAQAYPQYDPNCNPLVIVGGSTPNDGNCPLYPGVYKLGFLGVSNHSYKTVDMTTNGIFVGYRWFEKHDVEPLFPFGHGESYTRFAYSKLSVKVAPDGGLDVKFRVQNKGNYDGDEVVQVYLTGGEVPAGVQMAEKSLVGFERVTLQRGKWVDLTFHITPRQMSYWSVADHDWVVSGGERKVLIGGSSANIAWHKAITITP